jgi:DNA-binding transcriptional ArsR family regulator
VSVEPTPDHAAHGDVDLAAVGTLLADPGRCRVLMALGDGRALPASLLAAEAEVSPSTASSHLRKLLEGGLLTVEVSGRHRYYRLAGPEVGALIETVSRLAPARPVRSLRQGTRAHALRHARTCYDHLAGRLGVALMRAFLVHGYLTGGDGRFRPDDAVADQLAGYGRDVDYHLTPAGRAFLADFGAALPSPRPVVRYCVDWSEQHHHLSGAVGRALLDRLVALGWIRRASATRAVHLTPAGRQGLRDTLGIDVG